MEVKDFSEQITLAATKNAKGKRIGKKLRMAIGLGGGLLSTLTTIDYFGNPFYHASGFLAHAINRGADKYSSYQCSKLAEDSRFREYGLEEFWEETNTFYSTHPSRKETLFNKNTAIQEVVAGIYSTLLPPVGHGSFAIAPFLYEQNWTITNRIKKAFEIGDEVKGMIEKGLSEEEINSYLDSLIKRGKDNERN